MRKLFFKTVICGIVISSSILVAHLLPNDITKQITDIANTISSKFFDSEIATKNTASQPKSSSIPTVSSEASKDKKVEPPKLNIVVIPPKPQSEVIGSKPKATVTPSKPKSTLAPSKPKIIAVQPPKPNIIVVQPPKLNSKTNQPLSKPYEQDQPAITENNISNPAIEFISSNSLDEAQAFAVNKLFIYNANYTGFDLMMANALNNRIVYAYNLLPKLTGIVKFVGTDENRINKAIEVLTPYYTPEVIEDIIVKSGLRSKAAASFWYPSIGSSYLKGLDGIAIHEVLSANYDFSNRIVRSSYDSISSPKDCFTIESIMDHEIGHAIDRFFHIAENQEIIDFHASLSVEEITYDLSDYATTSLREFIAEAWSEYMNTSEPRPIAKKIGEFIMAQSK